MIRAILAAAALLLSACAPTVATPPDETAGPVKVDWQAAKSPEQCAAIKGNWQPVCMRGTPSCVVTFADAGKSCADSSECSGRCQTKDGNAHPGSEIRGQCTATSDPCGCFQLVENGKAGHPLCAD